MQRTGFISWLTVGAVAFVGGFLAGAGPATAQLRPQSQLAQDGRDHGPYLDLMSARVTQTGPTLTVRIRSYRPVTSKQWQRGSLCFTWTKQHDRRKLCVVAGPHRQLALRSNGRVYKGAVRKQGGVVSLAVDLSRGLLPYGHGEWTVTSSQPGARCAVDRAFNEPLTPIRIAEPRAVRCVDHLPAFGSAPFLLLHARANGCMSAHGQVLAGTDRRQVALTFDDGPSEFTPAILRILRQNGAHGTFFQIGQQISSFPAIERQLLADGNLLANHTWGHPSVASGGTFARSQLQATNSAFVRTVHGYRPCLMRPPYGATSKNLVATAAQLGLKVVLWNVDTNDWKRPGTTSIIGQGANAPGGAIVLMHDGGGDRSQTVAALPTIIRRLQARGLELVTVADMLHLPVRYTYSRH